MMLSKLTLGLSAVLLVAGFGFGSAHAAPLTPSAAAIIAPVTTDVMPVHARPYRHCHWRNGRKWCHGPHYYRGYYGPGVTLYFGKKPRYYKHRKYHHRKYHHHYNKKRWR